MLRNELYPIKELVENLAMAGYYNVPTQDPASDEVRVKIHQTFAVVRNNWSDAAFSTPDDRCLKRFFSFHLEGVREFLDTLHSGDINSPLTLLLTKELLELIAYQRQYFGDYFNYKVIAPLAFCEAYLKSVSTSLSQLTSFLEKAVVDEPLKKCLLSHIRQMDAGDVNATYTYGALFYFERLLNELVAVATKQPVADLNAAVVTKLTSLNFNALDFFCYRQRLIRKAIEQVPLATQLQILLAEVDALNLLPEPSVVYDGRWPSLQSMLKGWLAEEIAAVKGVVAVSTYSAPDRSTEKLSLNFSVAHLACFTRLLFEENIFNSTALTPIFKFMAGHCQTKRQHNISAGSLSKEYYSVSQVTAAVVRDKLLKMISRINREYFPVVAVISAATLLYSALR